MAAFFCMQRRWLCACGTEWIYVHEGAADVCPACGGVGEERVYIPLMPGLDIRTTWAEVDGVVVTPVREARVAEAMRNVALLEDDDEAIADVIAPSMPHPRFPNFRIPVDASPREIAAIDEIGALIAARRRKGTREMQPELVDPYVDQLSALLGVPV